MKITRRCLLSMLSASPTLRRAYSAEPARNGVKIGVLTDMGGIYSDFTGQGSLLAARMAAEDFGGILLGGNIEVIGADHQNKPDVASSIARSWYDQDGVDLIVDVVGSNVALAVQEVARARKKVLIAGTLAAMQFTNEACSDTGINWLFTGYSKSKAFADALVRQGMKRWFFITVDSVGGMGVQKPLEAALLEAGGSVLGTVRFPLGMSDFSSVLLTASSANPQVVVVAAAGADAQSLVKQGSEFHVFDANTRFLLPFSHITDIEALGLEAARGAIVVEPFYWDLNDQSRAWSRRFFARMKRMPTDSQAGIYTSVFHYLKAAAQARTDAGPAVIAAMRDIPINDFMTKNGRVRIDGDVERQQYIFEVKQPSDSKESWDFYKFIGELEPSTTTYPLGRSACPLVK